LRNAFTTDLVMLIDAMTTSPCGCIISMELDLCVVGKFACQHKRVARYVNNELDGHTRGPPAVTRFKHFLIEPSCDDAGNSHSKSYEDRTTPATEVNSQLSNAALPAPIRAHPVQG
jgi:hypothetical protein